MTETRELIIEGIKVTLKDGDYECSYIMPHPTQREHEDAMFRTPARRAIEHLKAMDHANRRD